MNIQTNILSSLFSKLMLFLFLVVVNTPFVHSWCLCGLSSDGIHFLHATHTVPCSCEQKLCWLGPKLCWCHRYFCYHLSTYEVRRPSQLLTLPPQGVGWGWARSWEEAALGQLAWTGQRAVPCHLTSSSAIKLAADSSLKVTFAVGLAGQPVCLREVVSDCLCITWGFFY